MEKTIKKRIYLDYAATTPLDLAVLKKMQPYFSRIFGNPSSLHTFGQQAIIAVDKARNQMAEFLEVRPSEIIFTSGATESNNLAIKGAVGSFYLRQKPETKIKPHLIVSRIEHHCVLDTCHGLEKSGLIEVTYLPVSREGLVELPVLEKSIKDNTLLVSVMYANNEIGVIQPIVEIGALLQRLNADRKHKILFHSDATQALNYLDCRTDRIGLDLLSLSGHKIYGPKGVGALFVRKGTPVVRIQDGGGQEYNLRAGTLNVPGIVGLGEAISRIKSYQPQIKKIERLKNKLIDGLLKKIGDGAVNGSREKVLPNIVNLRFKGAEGESVLMALDLEGIAVSTGSACAARDLTASHVLLALGLSEMDAHYSVRFSLGKDTVEAEINRTLAILPKIIEKLRQISGRWRSL